VPSVIEIPEPALIVNVSCFASAECNVLLVPPFCDCTLANVFWFTSAPSTTFGNPISLLVKSLVVTDASVTEPILSDVIVNVSIT